MKHRSSGRRRTVEQEQERESRLQLALAWKSWPLQSSAEDLGEDLLFQIYADGNFTGLSFYVQLKSTTNLDALVPKRRKDSVAYTFEVKDLRHWEDSVPPVVLVIWDVEKKAGVWHDVPEVLKALDKKGKAWRSKKTVRVVLPMRRTTDDAGREALRVTIAHLALPVLSHGKTTTIKPTFTFPKTPEGQALFAALRRTIDEGDGGVTIPRENITKFRMSDWWERAYGVRIPDFVTISPSKSSITLPLRLQAVSPQRSASINLALNRMKAGLKRATFETPEASPLRVRLVLHEPDGDEAKIDLKVAFEHPCDGVEDSLSLTRFLLVARQGGTIQLALQDGTVLGEPTLNLDSGQTLDDFLWWENVLQKLSYIQSRVGRFGRFPVKKLTNKDIPTIERMNTILQTGQLKARISWSFTLSERPTLPERDDSKPATLSISANPFGEVKLLGVRIPLGEVAIDFLDPGALLDQTRAIPVGTTESTVVAVKDTPVVLRYLDWVSPKNGPEPVPEILKKTSRKKKASKD